MKTPVADYVKNYADSDFVRLHMPGHKGKSFLGCERLDITEIDGADVLYSAEGIIKESEKNAASLFSSFATFYSTEGSTLCIKAMLSLVCKGKKERPLILAARNVHKAFVYAGALIDFDVKWMYPSQNSHICACLVTPEEVESHILECKKKPDAVYVTSPDYLGNICDIKGISAVCRRYEIPLITDNAHGAYLGFFEESMHPIKLGATMCCDSAHKTLPVLTGGAYLHISREGKDYLPFVQDCLSLHASTSPSYLILQSLDLCNAYLEKDYRKKLAQTVQRLDGLKKELIDKGFDVRPGEPLKLTLSPLSYGYSGQEFGRILFENKICCEFCDRELAVMMFTPENSGRDFERLRRTLSELEKKEPVTYESFCATEPSKAKLTLRQAVFAQSEWLSTENAEGRICASPAVSCPPAVPVCISGEVITKSAIDAFRAYGIEKIKVIKE